METGRVDSFLFQNDVSTIHAFLGGQYDLRLIAVIASFVSLVGIIGPAMYEADFAAELVAKLGADVSGLSSNDPRIGYNQLLLFALFLMIPFAYIAFGGFGAVVRTDEYQLRTGYIGLTMVAVIIYGLIVASGNLVAGLFFGIASLLLSLILIWYWFKKLKNTKGFSFPWELTIGVVLYAAGVVYCIAANKNSSSVQSFGEFLSAHRFFEPLSLGIWPFLSLLIANGLYQLVDVSQWQRLASVQNDGESRAATRKTLGGAIRSIMIYSPVTWIIAIFLGMSLHYVSPSAANDPYSAFTLFALDFQKSGDPLQQFTVLVLILSCVAIMLSTVDSLISGIAFTVHNDLLGGTKGRFGNDWAARIMIAAVMLIGFILYVGVRPKIGNFSDILYSCWSMQISLFPVVIASLFGWPLNKWIAACSVVFGIVMSLLPLGITDMNPYSHGPVLSLLGSTLVAGVGVAIGWRNRPSIHNNR